MKLGFTERIIFRFVLKRRAEVIDKFFEVMSPSGTDLCLDIEGPGVGETILYKFFGKVIVVNIERRDVSCPEHVSLLIASGCHLPLRNKSVDFVFCNATIEHIPKEQRGLLSQEIERVTNKGYFISTPNYWFPFEFHYLMPFWQFLPECLKAFLLKFFSFDSMTRGIYYRIDLLTANNLRRQFPTATIKGFGMIPFLPETLFCYWRRDKA